jgi:type IV pilus assembly protein PilV
MMKNIRPLAATSTIASRNRGFTLLEVMISLVILAIGVMGVIGLQMATYKQLQTSNNYSKAGMLVSEMADRILANDEALPTEYTRDAPTSKPECSDAVDPNTVCTPQELAANDLWIWQAQLLAEDDSGDETKKLPGALPGARGGISEVDGEYIVWVRWEDIQAGADNENCDDLPGAPEEPGEGETAAPIDCFAINLGCLEGACP